MSVDELLQYIFGQGALYSPMFSRWVKSSEQFASFVERHKNKIRKKIRDAQKDLQPGEKLKDVIFELEVAYLLCKTSRFSVEYEQHGKAGPDFTVNDETGADFNIEVKRIRPGESPQVRFDLWKSYIKHRVHSIPSTLALYMSFGGDFDTSLDLIDRLEMKTSEIISYITDTIPVARKAILVEGKPHFSVAVPDFEGELVLRFRQPPYPTTTLADDGGESPIFRTGKEYRKFDELYWKALRQAIPDMINILAINTNSKTHDSWALRICMHYLNELARRNDIEKAKRLSGVLFRGAWSTAEGAPNVLWCDEEAYHPIPEDIGAVLRRMDLDQ
jgi:hypothetical protein